MLNKKIFLAAAILACSMSSVVMADDLEIHGYAKTGVMVDSELNSVGTNNSDGLLRSRASYNGTTLDVPANQFELVGTKKFSSDNGAQGRLDFRLEYGNRTDGAYYYYSSSGGEGKENFFELKEAYVTLEKLDFLPKDSSVWAGRKFYGRDSGALTGEFWKQSSGVGFGYDTNKFSMALVGADLVKAPDNSDANGNDSGKEQTAFVLDTRIKNIKVPGGNVELQVNLYTQKNAKTADELNNSKRADSGLGLGITYNIDGYYGVKKGWSKAGLAYGKGLGGSAKGLNFGSWLDGDLEDSKSILATTYGMVNLTDKLQVGTEVTLHNAEKVFGADDINRFGITVNPSYKITKNLRMTAEVAYTTETFKRTATDWSADLDNATTSLTLAPVITMNNDFYGRPQIKPFITFVDVDAKGSSKWAGYDGKGSGTFAGVVAEVWF